MINTEDFTNCNGKDGKSCRCPKYFGPQYIPNASNIPPCGLCGCDLMDHNFVSQMEQAQKAGKGHFQKSNYHGMGPCSQNMSDTAAFWGNRSPQKGRRSF